MPWAEVPVPAGPVLGFVLVFLGLPVLGAAVTGAIVLALAARFEVRAARRRRRHAPTLWQQWPTVSIIVAAHDAGELLAGCIRSVQGSRYERFELILVDAGSRDSTPEIMAGFAAEDGRIVFAGRSPAAYGAALNVGIRRATGEVLMFLPADAVLTRRTVDRMLQAFEAESERADDVGAVWGSERTPAAGPAARIIDLMGRAGGGMARRAQASSSFLPVFAGGLAAVRREVLADIGGFREDTAAAELELGWRVRSAGYRVGFAPRAVIMGQRPEHVGALWRRRVGRERSLLQCLKIHKSAIGDLRRRPLGDCLVATAVAAIILPALRTVGVLALPCLVLAGLLPGAGPQPDTWALPGALMLAAVSCAGALVLATGGSVRDLRHLWALPLLPFYAVFTGLAVLAALVAEFRAARSASVANYSMVENRALSSAVSCRRSSGVPISWPSMWFTGARSRMLEISQTASASSRSFGSNGP